MKAYGLTDRFAALAAEYPALTVARVTAHEKGLYRIVSARGEGTAGVSGRFRHLVTTASEFPAVGDFVMADVTEGSSAVIHDVLPRKSVFLRKAAGTGKSEQTAAANIDILFLCMALNHDYNLRRLERYLAIAWDSGAQPVVVLTKADLCTDLPEKLAESERVACGCDVTVTSGTEREGAGCLLPYLTAGRTVALIGSSDVGKSTLINRLLGEERIATGGLQNDDRGRHTTTHRELILLPGGGIVIDTPGMRELGVWDAGEGIRTALTDVETLSEQCRYRNCTHTSEPGCAVRAALSDGSLSAARYASFCKLSKENEFAEDSKSYMVSKEKKFKNISVINKKNRMR